MDERENALKDLLAVAASETLENLAFTSVEPKGEAALSRPGTDYRHVAIGLDGKGTLQLAIEAGLLEGLASTLFSMEASELGDERVQDALREILNIIAGLFVAGMPGDVGEFALGLPEIHRDPALLEACPVRCLLDTNGEGELALGYAPPAAGIGAFQ